MSKPLPPDDISNMKDKNINPLKPILTTASNRLPGSGVRRDLKEAWGSIKSKSETGHASESNNSEARVVSLDRLQPNPNQPRRTFDVQRDEELAQDVRERGILEPIIVRPVDEDEKGTIYQIVAGERRYRAAMAAELNRVPIIVKNFGDEEAKFTSLVENLQRLDLDPFDEGQYFQILVKDYNYSYRQIATMVHRGPTYVSDRIKLLTSDAVDISSANKKKIGIEDQDELVTTDKHEQQNKSVSEKNNKRSLKEHKLNISQSIKEAAPAIRPVMRFREYVDKARTNMSKMKPSERVVLVEHITELREQLQLLEEEAKQSETSK